ncbi:MAG: hypothetical protein RR444_03305 [Oscillospiraceae bacterium]
MTNNFLPTGMEEVIKKIDNSSWIREIDESLAPYKDIFDEESRQLAPIISQIKKIDEIMTPYKDIFESFSNIGKGKVFVDSFLEKNGDTPLAEISSIKNNEQKSNNDLTVYAENIINDFNEYLPYNDISTKDFITAKCSIAKISIENNFFDNAYFNLYFLFMLYIYNCIWKLSQSALYKQRFKEISIFLKAYEGKSQKKATAKNKRTDNVVINNENEEMVDIDFCKVEDIFDFARIPDKNIIKVFTILGADNGFISKLDSFINLRNDLAHATNESKIIDKDSFVKHIGEVKSSMKKINEMMKGLLHHWFLNEFLIKTINGEYEETISSDFKIVWESMILDFSLSPAEIEACGSFGLQKYIKDNRNRLADDEIKKLKEINKYVKENNFN